MSSDKSIDTCLIPRGSAFSSISLGISLLLGCTLINSGSELKHIKDFRYQAIVNLNHELFNA